MRVLIFSLCLASCSPAPDRDAAQAASDRRRAFISGYSYGTSVWTDPDTGCQYLVFRVDRGVASSPRMRRDGTQVCRA